ncbi:hypothetical protein EZS27_000714 [termite gut metagenome]|uniref:Uncharacterized protein n=1 Tax=termite gut metagenome TaxID=433724 RepID=A0A5J4T0W6_9ZZZZ
MKHLFFIVGIVFLILMDSCISVRTATMTPEQRNNYQIIGRVQKKYTAYQLPFFIDASNRAKDMAYNQLLETAKEKHEGDIDVANITANGSFHPLDILLTAYCFMFGEVQKVTATGDVITPKNHVEAPPAEAPAIRVDEAKNRVSRDNPGGTALERTIIRWNFDSDPRGSRIFWRVISSVPDEVKNTNELYLTTTPYEETRSFNIMGLTYDNSRDVTVEIKVTKKGYEDQVKRYNVRQAIDQQEISGFFELVKKETE